MQINSMQFNSKQNILCVKRKGCRWTVLRGVMVSYISYMLMYMIIVFDADVGYERMLTMFMLMSLRQRHRNLKEQHGSWV
jgi:hypothetical protein